MAEYLDTDVAFRIRVTGRVQGVFFRSTMKSVADENTVVGWVRNLPDGSVEAVVQGKRNSVLKVMDWCRTGPDRAVVESFESSSMPIQMSYRNFAILYRDNQSLGKA